MKVSQAAKEKARVWHGELLERKLEVVLVPAPEPKHVCHQIRVAVNRPPDWFSAVAQRHKRTRKRMPVPDFIKRANTLKALEAIAAGEIKTDYAKRWLREINRHLANELERIPF